MYNVKQRVFRNQRSRPQLFKSFLLWRNYRCSKSSFHLLITPTPSRGPPPPPPCHRAPSQLLRSYTRFSHDVVYLLVPLFHFICTPNKQSSSPSSFLPPTQEYYALSHNIQPRPTPCTSSQQFPKGYSQPFLRYDPSIFLALLIHTFTVSPSPSSPPEMGLPSPHTETTAGAPTPCPPPPGSTPPLPPLSLPSSLLLSCLPPRTPLPSLPPARYWPGTQQGAPPRRVTAARSSSEARR